MNFFPVGFSFESLSMNSSYVFPCWCWLGGHRWSQKVNLNKTKSEEHHGYFAFPVGLFLSFICTASGHSNIITIFDGRKKRKKSQLLGVCMSVCLCLCSFELLRKLKIFRLFNCNKKFGISPPSHTHLIETGFFNEQRHKRHIKPK